MLHRHDLRHHFDRAFEIETFTQPEAQQAGKRIQLPLTVDRHPPPVIVIQDNRDDVARLL